MIDFKNFAIDKVVVLADKIEKTEKILMVFMNLLLKILMHIKKYIWIDKMFPINWSLFTIPKGEIFKKIDV